MATTTKSTPTSEHDRGPFVPADTELAALKRAAQALRAGATGSPKLVAPTGEKIELSPTLLRVLRRSAEILADDQAVLLDSLGKQISPHQAAELLGFSVTYVTKLLDDGELPFTLLDDFRRLSLDDVLTYRRAFKLRQREALNDMIRLSEELGLYDLDDSTIELKRLAEFEEEEEQAKSGNS